MREAHNSKFTTQNSQLKIHNSKICIVNNILKTTVATVSLMVLTACNGIFDDIYDDPKAIVPAKGQLVIDATSWTDWYYVDLKHLQQLAAEADDEALLQAQTQFVAYPIPLAATGNRVSVPAADATQGVTQGQKAGQYMYWFDVFGVGIKNNTFAYFTPTEQQAEPSEWSFAVHRNNVRTNGGAALKTSYTAIDQLPESSEAFKHMVFTDDEWTENQVWDSQEQMLTGYVPSQGITINRVLSSWLTIDIPPMPPAFSIDNHVFVLRLNDGTYAALQLENYLSPNGTKCFLTINYKYPY